MHKMFWMALLLLYVSNAQAKVLFEGIYKIERNATHTGYLIQRHEIDESTKVHTISYFMWRHSDENAPPNYYGARVTAKASLTKEKSGSELRYISQNYELFQWLPKGMLVSRADFSKNLSVKESLKGKVVGTETVEIPRNGFASTFIPLLLAGVDHLPSNGQTFAYDAVAEESHQFHEGEITVLGTKTIQDHKVIHAVNSYQSEDIEYFILPNGEVLGYRNPLNKTVIYLVGSRELGVGDLSLPKDAIQRVFGGVPFGINNVVSDSKGKFNSLEAIHSFTPSSAPERQPSQKPGVARLYPRTLP